MLVNKVIASVKVGKIFKYLGHVRPVTAKGRIKDAVKVKGTFEVLANVHASDKGCVAAENHGKIYLINYKIPALAKETHKWSKKVHTKWHPKPGTFKNGTAESIAKEAQEAHPGDLGGAIKALTFEINRGGSSLPEEIKSKVKHARNILHKKLEKHHEAEKNKKK